MPTWGGLSKWICSQSHNLTQVFFEGTVLSCMRTCIVLCCRWIKEATRSQQTAGLWAAFNTGHPLVATCTGKIPALIPTASSTSSPGTSDTASEVREVSGAVFVGQGCNDWSKKLRNDVTEYVLLLWNLTECVLFLRDVFLFFLSVSNLCQCVCVLDAGG